jgi:DNA-damage-inducible protein D
MLVSIGPLAQASLAVRKTLLERGIRPETLPAAEDVKKVERRLASEEKQALKKPHGLGSSTEE